MSELIVTDTTVPGVLDRLRKSEWLVPKFQREFVWTTEQVSSLVQSVLDARPIGMVTLWEQPGDTQLLLERLSIPDHDASTGMRSQRFFGPEAKASKNFALLDGRQRCTALAMAFGGFRAHHGTYRYSGRYFLDVTETDPRKRVKFFREAEISKRQLLSDASCFSKGLFPLAPHNPDESVMAQWMRYLQAIQNAEYYPGGVLPQQAQLDERNGILQAAFQGIVNTKMAVYIVPDKYDLSDICEIFETLNTTGTKVSTVDLIHSWLYSDTIKSAEGPFLLRDWIGEMSEIDGAVGWADDRDRPELLAQFSTATYVALTDKSPPRQVGGRVSEIRSVKAGDLLATPTEHWRALASDTIGFAECIGKAQQCVAGGFFSWIDSPYPVSLGIYVALRWKKRVEAVDSWSIDELDSIFRAFFWRNALARRYDQGFLTQLGTDLIELLAILEKRKSFHSSSEWASNATLSLDSLIARDVPTFDELVSLLTDGVNGGAIQKALVLPMIAGARTDLINSARSLAFPSSTTTELHHIYPKKWCANNKAGALTSVLNPDVAGRDYVNSVSNLMPLSRESNQKWKAKIPGQFITESALSFESMANTLKPLFIDKHAFNLLSAGAESLPEFWHHRARSIASHLLALTRVVI